MKNESHYEYPVNLYISKSYDDAETAQNFIKALAGEQLTVSKGRNGDYLYVSIEGYDEDIDAFLDVYKDKFTGIVWDCDADANGWVKPKDVYDSVGQNGKELPEESKVGEGRSNEDYLQEVWDSLAVAWDKDKFNMGKGYDSEYERECITITSKDNEEVRAKIYVEDYEGRHPAAFEVVYRYPGDKGVGVMGTYEFQSTDMDGLGEEVFDYFDEIQKKVGEAMKNENGANADVYTIDLTRISSDGYEEGIDDMQAAQIFYDEDDAIKTAKELADSYQDDDDVVQVTVMAGQYETPSGIFGEPFDIFTASSSDSKTTAEYRKKANYVKATGLDYYANGGKAEKSKQQSESFDMNKAFFDAKKAITDWTNNQKHKTLEWIYTDGRKSPTSLPSGIWDFEWDTGDGMATAEIKVSPYETRTNSWNDSLDFALRIGTEDKYTYYTSAEDVLYALDKLIRDTEFKGESKKSESDETSWALEYLVETAKEKGLKVSKESPTEICITVGTFPHQDHIFVTDDAPGKDDTSLELYVPAAHINTSGLTLQDVLDYLDDPIGKRDAVQFKNGNRLGKAESNKSEADIAFKDSYAVYKLLKPYIDSNKFTIEHDSSRDPGSEITITCLTNPSVYARLGIDTDNYDSDTLLVAWHYPKHSNYGDIHDEYDLTETSFKDIMDDVSSYLEECLKNELAFKADANKSEGLPPKKLGGNRKYRSRADLINKMKTLDAVEITTPAQFNDIHSKQWLHTAGYAMDINGNLVGQTYFGDKDGKWYYATTKTFQGDYLPECKESEAKKSESLTLKQKELKDMARFGQAEDITTISDAEAKELKKKGIETVGISRGVYGMNGALLRDNEGNKYVITARSSNLFYFV